MKPTGDFDLVLTKLADGESVDWESASQSAVTPDDADLLRQLRIVEQIAATHRLAGDQSWLNIDGDTGPARTETTTAAPDEAIGRRWGRYRLVRLLGRGSYGEVHLAHDEALDRHVAIKLLHPSTVLGAELGAQVRREGRALARVRHANVLTVYDVEEHGQQLGLCMEYVDGRTLDALVRADGPLNAGEAAVVGQAVCRGLAALHEAGIVHRDVKARNVMRERAGRIVLMDLGAGLEFQIQQASGEPMIGTPVYMAPELLEGGPATPQSDIYAVGVLLYFLVTGGYPVVGGSVAEIRAAHRRTRRTRLDERRLDLPEGFVRAVERATTADPALRHESVAALLRDLGTVVPDPRSASLGPAVGVRALRWAAVVVTGVLALAALSGFVASYTFNRVLDRPASFDPDSVGDKIILGFSTLVLPAAVGGVVLGAAAVLGLAFKLLPFPRRFARAFLARLRIPEPEQASLLARLVVLAGFLAVGAIFVVFGDVVQAFVSSVSEHDLSRFVLLSPEGFGRTSAYRLTVPALLFVVIAAWKGVHRVRLRCGGEVPSSAQAGAIALAILLIAAVQAPYKLSSRNHLPVATVEGQRCYVLGVQGPVTRVYCPASAVPRVRSVAQGGAIQACGFEENVFLVTRATGCTRDGER